MYPRHPIQKFAHRRSLKIGNLNGADGTLIAPTLYYGSLLW